MLFPWIEKDAQQEKIENAEKVRYDYAATLWNITCCTKTLFNQDDFENA